MGARREGGPESINGQKSSNFDLFIFLLFPFSIVYLLGEAIFLALKKPKKKMPIQKSRIMNGKFGEIKRDQLNQMRRFPNHTITQFELSPFKAGPDPLN